MPTLEDDVARASSVNAAVEASGDWSARGEPSAFPVERVRKDFPTLRALVHGRPVCYLDSAASALKPQAVIDRISRFYADEYASVHRGVHTLSAQATRHFEGARTRVQRFLNAAEAREVVFVRGATEAINLVAWSFARPQLAAGDEIIVSGLEHHSNIVPWQMICEERGARLRVLPIDDRGDVEIDQLDGLLSERTRLVAIAHVSNALGTVVPIREIIERAHAHGVPVLVDGAQAVPHMRVDVRALECDFYVFSGHKLFGPSGIGALYGRAELLEKMPPYQGGGAMIRSVTFERTTYADIPERFEAGTPNIAGAIGLGAAIDYLDGLDQLALTRYEHALLDYAESKLGKVPGVEIIGRAREKAGVVSFVLDGVHPHDLGTILDQEGVAIRAGHHCAQPVMERFGLAATARASFAFYNTRDEVDTLVEAVEGARELFAA